MSQMYKEDWELVKGQVESELRTHEINVIAAKAVLAQMVKQIGFAEKRPVVETGPDLPLSQ